MDLSYLLPNPNKKLTADKKKKNCVKKFRHSLFYQTISGECLKRKQLGLLFFLDVRSIFLYYIFALHGYVIPIRVVHALFVLDVPLLPSSNVHVLIQDVDH